MMSCWIHCNACCLSPSSDRKLAVTSCGHVFCSLCYQKHTQAGGNPEECLICKSKCNLSPLNDKSSSEVKSLFSDIKTVAVKHFKEIGKVVTFQSRHQKRLLTYSRQRNGKLEEALFNMKQEMHELTKKLNEQSAHISQLEYSLQHQSAKASSLSQQNQTSYNLGGYKTGVQIPYSCSVLRHPSSTNLSDNMEMGERSMFRKPNTVPRLSLISPSQDGGIGAVLRSSLSQSAMANHSTCSATVSRVPGTPLTPDSNYGESCGWKSPLFRPSLPFRHSSMSSLICPTP